MNWKIATAAMLGGALLAAALPAVAEDVVIKVWSRADRSGPLRAGNLVAAADTLNKMLAATGADKRVKIELNETNAKGYDEDALDLLKAFAVDKGPDIFVLAHEWTGAFAEAGYAWNLEDHIAKNPELYGDIKDGTSSARITVASKITPAERPIPNCLMSVPGPVESTKNARHSTSAALVTSLPVRERPSAIACAVLPVASYSSRIRVSMKTS